MSHENYNHSYFVKEIIGEKMFSLFKKKAKDTMIIDGSELSAPIKKGQTLLSAGINAKLKFPNMCNVGECGTCRCKVLKGDIKLKRDITNHIPIEEIKKGYVLACQSISKGGDILVQVPGLSSTDNSIYTSLGSIEKITELTHDTYSVTLKLDKPIQYVGGQYGQILVPGVEKLTDHPRNYSFSTYPKSGESTSVEFFIRHVPSGLFTDWLFAKDRTGQKIELSGPHGDFYYRDEGRPILCIAGGSGLAPVKSLLEQLNQDGRYPKVTLMFGAREQRDLYCQSEFEALAKQWSSDFNVHEILSAEPTSSDWQGLRGFVTQHIDDLIPNLSDHDIYLCGPPVMIDSVISHIGDQVPTQRIHFDKFLDQSSI